MIELLDKVVYAQYRDIMDMIKINHTNLLKNNLDSDVGKSGFLVVELSEIDLKNKEEKYNKIQTEKNEFDYKFKDMEDHYLNIIKEKDKEIFEFKKKLNKLDRNNSRIHEIDFLLKNLKNTSPNLFLQNLKLVLKKL